MNAKMTFQTASEIRILYREGKKQVELAEKYGICQAAVSDIISNKTWYDPLHKVIPKAKHLSDTVIKDAYLRLCREYVPMKELAEELGINYRTLERRMRILKQQGQLDVEVKDELGNSSVSGTDGDYTNLCGDSGPE